MQRWSTSEFIFMRMRACLPSRCAAAVRSISSSSGSRIESGATSTLRSRPRMRVAGERVEEVGDLLADLAVGREVPEVLVQPGVLGVEVAGSDHHVVTDLVVLTADDEDRLGVCLQARDAVHDVGADLLELT